jgi:hypothetical protein
MTSRSGVERTPWLTAAALSCLAIALSRRLAWTSLSGSLAAASAGRKPPQAIPSLAASKGAGQGPR